uniref:Putative secreted protein n=1 Tax=Amblyomma triste TaxID=251400 RepID=A0A023G346_AMBTT
MNKVWLLAFVLVLLLYKVSSFHIIYFQYCMNVSAALCVNEALHHLVPIYASVSLCSSRLLCQFIAVKPMHGIVHIVILAI